MIPFPNPMIEELAAEEIMGQSRYAVSETVNGREAFVEWGPLDWCNAYISAYTDDEMADWDVKLYLITPEGLTTDF